MAEEKYTTLLPSSIYDEPFNASHYEGEFNDDDLPNHGVYMWPDGRQFEGAFENSRFHGRGIFTYSDRRKYVGEFRDNERNGRGTLTWADGTQYEGEFTNGRTSYGEVANLDDKKLHEKLKHKAAKTLRQKLEADQKRKDSVAVAQLPGDSQSSLQLQLHADSKHAQVSSADIEGEISQLTVKLTAALGAEDFRLCADLKEKIDTLKEVKAVKAVKEWFIKAELAQYHRCVHRGGI